MIIRRILKIFAIVVAGLGLLVGGGMKGVVSQLHKAGVRIHVGTDSPNPFVVPGAGFHQELRLLVEAGLTPEEVWLAATRWAGESLPVDNFYSKFASISIGPDV